jgi:hypothetical protein
MYVTRGLVCPELAGVLQEGAQAGQGVFGPVWRGGGGCGIVRIGSDSGGSWCRAPIPRWAISGLMQH